METKPKKPRKSISFKLSEDDKSPDNEEDMKFNIIPNITRNFEKKLTLDKSSFSENRKKLETEEFKDAKMFYENHKNEFINDQEVEDNTKKNSLINDVRKDK